MTRQSKGRIGVRMIDPVLAVFPSPRSARWHLGPTPASAEGVIPGTNRVDGGQKLTLPGGDSANALQERLWNQTVYKEDGLFVEPEAIKVTVTFETEPLALMPLRKAYAVETRALREADEKPFLAVKEIARSSST